MVSISYDKVTLSNGLDVILHEDHSLPMTAVNVWYHVGSKNEEEGRTGFAHLFEHVMFEGSEHHNSTYFDPLQKAGANLNGSTSADRTNYWENVPSNYLELALWLESDRMGFLLDALDQERFDIQRDVVKNERRQSYENRPYAMSHMLLQPAVFPAPHPYSWMTIGTPEDLQAASLEDVKAFFRRFYAPSNASLAIVGDFVPAEAQRLVERYFGDLPPGPAINRVGRMDSKLRGQVTLTMQDRVQLPRLYLVWPTVPDFDRAQAPLDLLAIILGDGKASRLHRLLVHEKQVARDVGVVHHAQEIAGEFHLQVTASPGYTLERIEEMVREELERIQNEPPTERELASAKNRIESSHVRQLERFGGFGGRADQLNYYNTMAQDPGMINSDIDRYMAATVEDVQRAASTSLGDSQVRLSVLPQESLKPSAGTLDRSSMPKAAATPRFTPPVPTRARLSNGLNVVVVEKPGLPMVAFGLMLRAGAVTDPAGRAGLADLTASMLTEGTPTRSSQEISNEMEFLGSHLSSDATREYALLSAETLTSKWEAALEIMADVARNPAFPPDELERVRRERLVDLDRVADNPATIALRASRGLLYGPESMYGHPGSGTVESVEAMSREMLIGHYGRHYGPGDATFLVVGDITERDAVSSAEKFFGDWQVTQGPVSDTVADGEPNLREPTTIYLADKPGAAQSMIRAGHLTVPRLHTDYYALNFLNYVFGGQFAARLNMNLRQEKGYSYGYNSSIGWVSGPSALLAGGAVETAVTKESVFETLKEFADIRDARPVAQVEFDDARNGILKGLPAQFETQAQTLHQLTQLVLFDLPDDYFSEYVTSLKAVTLADVHAVAESRVDSAHLKVLVVGDREVVEPGLAELGLPMVAVDYDGRRIQ